MKPLLLAAIAAAAVPVALALAPSGPAAAAAERDWARTVVRTPEGGFRVGNPDAPVKLVEYGSLTCNHCASFAVNAMPKLLSDYVKGGRVSFEFRNFVRDPADMAASLLSRCAAASDFFALTDRYFHTQEQWITRFQTLTADQAKALQALPEQQRLARFAAVGGLDSIAARHGVGAAKARACLSDEAEARRLAEMRQTATDQHGIKGTPSFLVNGRTAQGVHDWASLEPLLRPPGS